MSFEPRSPTTYGYLISPSARFMAWSARDSVSASLPLGMPATDKNNADPMKNEAEE